MENANVEVSANEVSNAVVETNEFDTLKGLKFNVETFRSLIEIVQSQNARIEALESKNQTSSTKREMTIEDARVVMSGTLRDKSHKVAAAELGLSYGQVYSARIGATFKPITKELKEAGLTILWEPKQR